VLLLPLCVFCGSPPVLVAVPRLATFSAKSGTSRSGPLVRFKPTGMYDRSSRAATAAFKSVLDRARIPATVRLTRGRDIQAACGQLAATRS
jgi:hypothetical protein